MPIAEDTIERGLDTFLLLVQQDDALSREFRASVREFYGDRHPHGNDSVLQLAGRRHVEWFVLERPSATLDEVPVQGLVEGWLEKMPATEHDALEVLQATHAGIFEVTGVTPGEGVWIRDLAAFGEYPLYEPEGSMALETGDLLVGRIFPVGDSLYRISRAAAHFRNEELLQALRQDLERLRASHRGVMRLAQSELERMFWGSAPIASRPDAVAAARDFLLAAGLQRADVSGVFETLAAQPYDGARIVPGAGDALGAILSGLAFETQVDLEEARRHLIAAWAQLSQPVEAEADTSEQPTPQPPTHASGAVDVAAAMAAFERGRAEGRDLERLFDDLERQLELDDDSAADEGDVPDFPGVVGAMVEEFVWDVGREQGPSAAEDLRILGSLGEYAQDIGVFENLRPRDLLAYATVWVPQRGGLSNADDARRLVGALRSFCRWAEERQSLPLLSGFRDALRGVESSLPRIVEANRRGGVPCAPGEGALMEVVSVEQEVRARTADGPEQSIEAGEGQRAWLRPGDHVLVTPRNGSMMLCRCYPPEAKPILADLERA